MSSKSINEELLNRDNKDHLIAIGDFTCGADHLLNDFLYNYAFNYALNNYGKTYIIFYDEDIIAYYTLKAGSIVINTDKDGNGETVSLPLVEIARFAVAFDYQRQHIGTKVFNEKILPKIEVVASKIAIYGIMVFVLPSDNDAVMFYESLGFIKAGDDVQKNIDHFNEDCELYILKL